MLPAPPGTGSVAIATDAPRTFYLRSTKPRFGGVSFDQCPVDIRVSPTRMTSNGLQRLADRSDI